MVTLCVNIESYCIALNIITVFHALKGMRGTCWDFATMGLLEQSYRATGVSNGWLRPDEYVSFSEQVRQFTVPFEGTLFDYNYCVFQAYGKLMIDVCSNPDTADDCRVPGDEVRWGGGWFILSIWRVY